MPISSVQLYWFSLRHSKLYDDPTDTIETSRKYVMLPLSKQLKIVRLPDICDGMDYNLFNTEDTSTSELDISCDDIPMKYHYFYFIIVSACPLSTTSSTLIIIHIQ